MTQNNAVQVAYAHIVALCVIVKNP